MSTLIWTAGSDASIWINDDGQMHIDIHDLTRANFDVLPTDPALPVRHFDADQNNTEFWTKTVDLTTTPVKALHVYTNEAPPPPPPQPIPRLLYVAYQKCGQDEGVWLRVWIYREGREPAERMYDLPLHAFKRVRKMCQAHGVEPAHIW